MSKLLQGLLALLKRFAPAGGAPVRPHQQRLGRLSESHAARFLRRRGYRILERNFRTVGGEIDLVAFRDGVVVFVEVKGRTEPVGLDELQTVTPTKRARIISAAHGYATLKDLSREDVLLRFDVIAIRYHPDGTLAAIEQVQDAFGQ